MEKLNLVIFYGSVRSDRQGIKAARFIVNQAKTRGHAVTLLDPLELKLPLLDKMYKEYDPGQAPAVLQTMARAIVPADAYVVVTGEYNHSIPPALSNLIDHFLEEYFYKPSAIVSYSAGPTAGVRAAVQLRALLGEAGMAPIPSEMSIPRVQDAFDEEGTPTDPKMDKRADRFLRELEWYAGALKAARAKGLPA